MTALFSWVLADQKSKPSVGIALGQHTLDVVEDVIGFAVGVDGGGAAFDKLRVRHGEDDGVVGALCRRVCSMARRSLKWACCLGVIRGRRQGMGLNLSANYSGRGGCGQGVCWFG